jgi:rhodanese-related sulfurtransferase
MTIIKVSPDQLWELLHDGDEICVADIRDGGPFSRSHILAASSIPLAQFEVLVPTLIPRLSTRIVLCDEDEILAEKAAQILVENSYEDVAILAGGIHAWEREGYQLFSGSGIISKAFGELVEHTHETPCIEASVLEEWHRTGKSFLSFDARPLAEYRTVSLPHATDCPGAELVFRIPALLQDEEIPIVINCAGRTRSIIGAQSLRNAGLNNPIFALKNGTMGWQLAKYPTFHGQSNFVPDPEADGIATAQKYARQVIEKYGIKLITRNQLDDLQHESTRTTYVFDVRQADAFELRHVTGSLHAPGGQLIQATDSYVAVRHARLVLIDEHLVQSVMTAHWLQQMGWEVYVLQITSKDMNEHGSQTKSVLRVAEKCKQGVTVRELYEYLNSDRCVVVDIGESYWYREGRIPRSYYSMRSRLHQSLTHFRHDDKIVVCCSDGKIAPYAAADVIRMGFTDVSYLEGGRTSWRRAGHSVERIGEDIDDKILSETDDMWYPPWARKEGVDEAIMQYLTWEVGLLEPVGKETYIKFKIAT